MYNYKFSFYLKKIKKFEHYEDIKKNKTKKIILNTF